MQTQTKVKQSVDLLTNKYKQFRIPTPNLHIVLGSCFGSALDDINANSDWELKGETHFSELTALTLATTPGHPGVYRYYLHKKNKSCITFQLGRLHGYEGLTPKEVTQSVMCPRIAGTNSFILTNAAGSLKVKNPAGTVMLISDQVNLTGQNPLTGPNENSIYGTPLGPRFPDMSEVYDSVMRAKLKTALDKNKLTNFEGIYLGLPGPSFETPAEVQLFASWGMSAVGMSTVWEAISLKHSGAKIAGLSLMSNLACGLAKSAHSDKPEVLDHFEILETSKQSARAIVEAIFNFAALGDY